MTLINCMKCKKKTETKDEHVVSGKVSRLVGLCNVCGTKKSVFVKSQKGSGDTELKLSKSAYDDNAPAEVDGYKYDAELSNKKTRVYHNPETKKTIVSHKGTDPKDKTDLKNDALITAGALNEKTSHRVRLAKDITKKAEEKYKGDLLHTGHSLGSSVAKATQKKGQKVEGYNGGASPLDAVKSAVSKVVSKVTGKKDKHAELAKDRVEHLTVVDPISISNLLTPGKKILHKATKLNTHSLDNFKLTGNGKTKKPRGRPRKNTA